MDKVPSHEIFPISSSKLKNFLDIANNVFENLISIFFSDSAPDEREAVKKKVCFSIKSQFFLN